MTASLYLLTDTLFTFLFTANFALQYILNKNQLHCKEFSRNFMYISKINLISLFYFELSLRLVITPYFTYSKYGVCGTHIYI